MADDRINKQEWDADLIAPITGQLLEAGATLTARLRQGDTFIDLAASSGANGSWTIDRNELLNALQRIGDGAFSIEVKQTDLAGNISPTQIQQYYMDRTRPGRPALIAAPCTEDGWINLRDAGRERVELRISLADTQAVAGDRIVISGFARDHVHTLTAAEIASGLLVLRVPADVALQAPGEAPNLSVRLQARVEDQGGNVSENSNAIETRLDTIVLVPSIDVSRGAAAGITKAQSNAPVDFYGAGAEAGASIAVVLTGVLGTSLLLPSTAQADGSFKVTLSPRDMQDLGDGPVSYRVTQTDAALKGQGIDALLKSVLEAHAAAFAKLPTPKLTRVLQAAIEHQAPPRKGQGSARPKLRYAHQGGQNPPIIVIHGNSLENVPKTYQRYLEGRFREAFKLQGTPLRIDFKSSTNPYLTRANKR